MRSLTFHAIKMSKQKLLSKRYVLNKMAYYADKNLKHKFKETQC